MMRYGFVLWTAARQQWVYRAELAMRAVQMVLFMGVFMALWTAAFSVSGRTELAGYRLADMVWYLAMTETLTLSSSRVFVEISEAVKAGDLAYTLARPLSYPFYQVANSLGNSAPRFLLNLLTASAVVGLGMGRIAGSPQGFLAFLGMAALALLLDALIAVLIGLSAFWIEEVMPAFWIYQKLLFTVGGLFLPLAFVAFEPEFVLQGLAGQMAYVATFAALVVLVWRRAQRRLVVHGG